MTTSLITHTICIDHDPSESHPESPERLRRIMERLKKPEFEKLHFQEAPKANIAQISTVHPTKQINRIFSKIPKTGYAKIDRDTITSPRSGEAALRAAGAVIAAVDVVMSGVSRNAFCATRPPGHHAEANQSMGFCLFNNVAIGAFHARNTYKLDRIAVMDFDVHHGNGTQKTFWNESNMLYASTHQSPLYPGTGTFSERGATNNIINVPLPPGSGSNEFRGAMSDKILPEIHNFKPNFILISAGFDAHTQDPLAQLNLNTNDYVWATNKLCDVADKFCEGRLVSTLEGGYDLNALEECVAKHVQTLMIRSGG